jgi:NADH-quinone oxidoreductase subunit M
VHDFRVPILVLATIGLLYGSLLAFRAPDVRGVIAYSSLAQMGLITLGLFAANDLGFDGAILQSVNHGLVSAALFLLAAMVERRTSTGEFDRLGGMARGRPLLATVLITAGVLTLAVPFSANFAGEFLVLAGVFRQGWAYGALGALAMVLAAMYALRLISAVLHREPGSSVSDAALDLRPAELGIVVPLVACLLALSAWPAAISGHAFGGTSATGAVSSQFTLGAVDLLKDCPAQVGAALRAASTGKPAVFECDGRSWRLAAQSMAYGKGSGGGQYSFAAVSP